MGPSWALDGPHLGPTWAQLEILASDKQLSVSSDYDVTIVRATDGDK